MKKIDDYTTKYGLGSVVNNEEIELFLQEIKNKLILVAVVGEVSSGKSTLINAFLRDRSVCKHPSSTAIACHAGSYHRQLGKLLMLGYLLDMIQMFTLVLVMQLMDRLVM